MGTERIVQLLRSHRVRIARALVRQTRALAPRYQQVDGLAQEHSYVGLIFAVERVLELDDESALRDQTEHLAEMRVAMGFQMEDFLLATLGWLPVIRRFIFETARNVDDAIADYDAFEGVALPLVARAASTFLEAEEEPTLPNARRRATASKLRALPIERVSGSEDEENEPTYRNFTPFTSSTKSEQ